MAPAGRGGPLRARGDRADPRLLAAERRQPRRWRSRLKQGYRDGLRRPRGSPSAAGFGKPLEPGDLGVQPDRGERVRAHAAQPRDRLLQRGSGISAPIVFTSASRRITIASIAEVLKPPDLRAALELRQPAAVAARPGAGRILVADVVSQQQLAQSLPRPTPRRSSPRAPSACTSRPTQLQTFGSKLARAPPRRRR
jgi:hypothetical protein